MVHFNGLIIGKEYDRPFLARLWGYQTFNAISRGVITPRGQNVIVLFITKEKQESLTQYEDHIDNDLLFWEGVRKVGLDDTTRLLRLPEKTLHYLQYHKQYIFDLVET